MELLQVIPLGGAGEIGRNCYVVMQGNDMVVIDAGISFPNEEMYGVDIVIPDFTFVVENRDKLRGIFLTHGHEDHTGSLPFLLSQVKCPIYASKFTLEMIKPKLEEKIGIKGLTFKPIKSGDRVRVGKLEVEPIQITHSIPENCAMAIRTTYGIVLFTSDFKFDFTPVDGNLSDINRLSELAEEGVLLMLSDSTNIERKGWGPTEKSVAEGLRQEFHKAKGRIFLTTFASNIHRLQQAINIAEETGRKFAVIGRSMEQSINMCYKHGYLKFSPQSRIFLDEIGNYEPHEILILTTGSQGEPMSALVQMSKGDYSRMRIVEGDTILYSARPIPGNEAAIWRTINRLFRIGAHVVYETVSPIHASGHAYQEELKMMINIARPYYLAPVHGEPRHHYLYKEMAREMGYPDNRVFDISDGMPLCIDEERAWVGESVPSGEIYLDKSGVTQVTHEVMREKAALANEGILIVNILMGGGKAKKKMSIDIKHKGFSGNVNILNEAEEDLYDELMKLPPETLTSTSNLELSAKRILGKFIQRRTQLRPVIVCIVHML